ncbi:MAG: hypothetical protein ACUVV5_10260 [Candidatus Aminicenantales bacterium]
MRNQSVLSSLQQMNQPSKKERAFELSLPTLVKGKDSQKNKFRERTHLLSISAEQATLRLRAQVAVGSRLDLELEIPKTLILENHLRLHLSGTVILAENEPNRTGKKRLTIVRLDRRFKLLPVSLAIH